MYSVVCIGYSCYVIHVIVTDRQEQEAIKAGSGKSQERQRPGAAEVGNCKGWERQRVGINVKHAGCMPPEQDPLRVLYTPARLRP